MNKLLPASWEILTLIPALVAMSVGSLILLVVALLVIGPVLIVEALRKLMQSFPSRNQTT
jgi:hypothetical protein